MLTFSHAFYQVSLAEKFFIYLRSSRLSRDFPLSTLSHRSHPRVWMSTFMRTHLIHGSPKVSMSALNKSVNLVLRATLIVLLLQVHTKFSRYVRITLCVHLHVWIASVDKAVLKYLENLSTYIYWQKPSACNGL